MAMKLSPHDTPTDDRIAKALGISRQAASLRLQAAGYHLLKEAHLAFLRHYTDHPQRLEA